MADYYYGFSLSTAGSTTGTAYYYVTVDQGVSYDGASVTVYPTNAVPSYFNYRSNSVQWQAAAGRLTAGMTVVTGANNIAGVLGASPALNVALTLTCYGGGGTIGSVTLPAGQSEIPFNFPVNPSESIQSGGGQEFLDKVSAKPE